VLPQKQAGYVFLGVKVHLGDFYIDQRGIGRDLVERYAKMEIPNLRFGKNFLIRDVSGRFGSLFLSGASKRLALEKRKYKLFGRYHRLSRYLILVNLGK